MYDAFKLMDHADVCCTSGIEMRQTDEALPVPPKRNESSINRLVRLVKPTRPPGNG